MDGNRLYRFGSFTFQPRTGCLTQGHKHIALTPKAADLLGVLLAHSGELVTKQELMEQVWPNTFVQENSLTFHIRLIRRALAQDGEGREYIETFPKRGYRFTASVSTGNADQTRKAADEQSFAHISEASVDQRSLEPVAVARTRSSVVLILAFGVVVALLGAAARSLSSPRIPISHVAGIRPLTNDGGTKALVGFLDSKHVIVRTPGGMVQYPIDSDAAHPSSLTAEYAFLDILSSTGEALAVKPEDRGAEDALWIVPLSGGPPHRLGMVKTSVAAWSPDGRTVAYANRARAAREDLVSVVVIGRDGQSARELQTFSGDVMRLRWAPDGRFIRVSVATRIDRDVLETLWDVDLSGKPRRVFADPRAPIFDGADWLISTGEEMFYGPRGASQIWLRQAAPHEGAEDLREITSGALQFVQSIPSPDGTRLYAIGNSGPRLLRYDADQRRFTPYLQGLAAFGLTFSRDRKWITYITEADGVLWRAAADGSGAKPLTHPPFRVDGASISPDGSRIAVRGGFGERLKVYLIGADGGVPEPLTADDVVQGIPSWSKRGDQLTYGDVPEGHGVSTGGEHIHVFDLTRHAASDLPDANEPLWSSRWSPDGRFIAALTIADQRLLIFDVEKRTWRSLGTTHVNSPEWTRDSRFVWCGPEASTFLFRRVRVDTGTVDRAIDVAPFTRQHDGAGLSSDEAPLLLQSTLDLYAIDLQRTAVKPRR